MSKGSSSYKCYKIEAKAAFPKQIGKMLLTKDWSPVDTVEIFDSAGVGVPNPIFCELGKRNGFLDYFAAKALKFKMLAELKYQFIGLQVRVVEYQAEVTHSFTPTGYEEIADSYYPVIKPKEGEAK